MSEVRGTVHSVFITTVVNFCCLCVAYWDSMAIMQYIGQRTGRGGPAGVQEAAHISEIAQGLEDFRTRYGRLVYSSDFNSLVDDYKSQTMPTWLGYFERILLRNGGFYGRGHYLVGEEVRL